MPRFVFSAVSIVFGDEIFLNLVLHRLVRLVELIPSVLPRIQKQLFHSKRRCTYIPLQQLILCIPKFFVPLKIVSVVRRDTVHCLLLFLQHLSVC